MISHTPRRLVLPGLPALLLLIAFLAAGCGGEAEDSEYQAPPPQVTVAHPIEKEVVEWDEYTGRLEAIDFVEVRARVSGYLQSIHFEDGEVVENGQLLFVVDPRPFEAEAEQAEADLRRAETNFELAKSNFERAERLIADNAIPREEFEIRRNTMRETEVAIEASRARLDAARLDVEFSEVRSPITGRISSNFVSEGNYVSGGSAEGTLLTTIVSVDPIYCTFEVSERDYLKYVRLDRSGKRQSSRDVDNPVYLQLADEEGWPHEGRMQFVDNRLDPETATMRARGVFPNPDNLLAPGLFARLRLVASDEYRAILIPDRAVGTDQTRKFVSVVGDDNVVERRFVELGPMVEGLRVVYEGLGTEERIVVAGLMRAQPGGEVKPKETTIEPAQGPEPVPESEVVPEDTPEDAPEDEAASAP